MPEDVRKKRPNLYYIFLEDQQANLMPPQRVDAIRQALFGSTDPPKEPMPPP